MLSAKFGERRKKSAAFADVPPHTSTSPARVPDFKVDALNPDLREVEQQYVLRTTDTTAAAIVGRNQVSPVGTVTSGALSTQQLVSTTGATLSTTRDVESHTTCATTSAAGTITVQLSPDNATYSTLVIVTPAVSLVTVDVVVRVPAGWFLKLTTSNATLGLTTFY
jgi:hypothetical protein